MSDGIPCPDCGHMNPPVTESCAACNFPLHGPAGGPPHGGGKPPAEPEAPAEPRATAAPGEPARPLRPVRPIRPRRPRPQSGLQLQLWLMFSIVAAAAVILIAVRANVERARQPIEGSSEEQQKRAAQIEDVLEKDSTNVEAHIGLANILYDTGNWSDAIVHYRAALARDSSRATVLVDLGVCYYNLSATDQAERLFRLALARDPHQPVALFNLGIVSERAGNKAEAMRYFHQALANDPPEPMKKALMEAMTRLGSEAGMKAPPLDQPPGSPPGR